MKKIILLTLATAFASASVFAQTTASFKLDSGFSIKPVAELYFGVEFDNREYDMSSYTSPYSYSRTLFGSKLTPLVGLSWGDWQSNSMIMVGSNLMTDFGATSFETKPDFVAYYQWTKNDAKSNLKIYGGVIPRFNMVGGYSSAFFSNDVMFYDTNVQGTMLQYVNTQSGDYYEFGCDWNSKFGEERREKFMLFASTRKNWSKNGGSKRTSRLYGGLDMMMYHHAGTVEEDGVVDNILINPMVGVEIGGIGRYLTMAGLQVGWLQAFQNDREYVGSYVKRGGLVVDLKANVRSFGLHNMLYLGNNLMPYYRSYGGGLYSGDSFFSTEENCYNRLEVFYRTLIKNGVQFKAASVHHYDGKGWGWQQLLSLSVRLNVNK